jgi:4-diphosphocytidyl-2-C-methyl-D-erythritol kinase
MQAPMPPASLHGCPAPAKLNLFLHVNGRRADGYHLLQTVFQLVDHGDTLHFDVRGDGLVRRTTELAGVPHEQTWCARAAPAGRVRRRYGRPAPASTWRSTSACRRRRVGGGSSIGPR